MGTIADKLQYLLGTKAAIKSALMAKGIEVSNTDTFRSYADKIGNISTGGSSGGDTVAGLSISDIFSIDENGKLNKATASAITCTAKDISAYGMYSAFQNCTSLTSINFPALTTISGSNGMNSAFYGCTSLTSINFPALTTISGNSGMYFAFQNCTGLASIDFPALTTISGSNEMCYAFSGCKGLASIDFPALTTISGGSGMSYAFQNCTGLTSIDFPALTTISGGSGMSYAFQNCTGLTSIDFPALTTISGGSGMSYAFSGCKGLASIDFPALTSTSFGTYTNQFNRMLYSVTGCTVHFPSNLQAVLSTWSDVTAGFGGTSTTVLFDLPATE